MVEKVEHIFATIAHESPKPYQQIFLTLSQIFVGTTADKAALYFKLFDADGKAAVAVQYLALPALGSGSHKHAKLLLATRKR